MPAEPTYTYSSNPATDTKDAVRFLLHDTNADGKGWLVSDEEILFAIATEGGKFFAAAMCAETVAASYSGPLRNIAEKKIGDLQIAAAGGARTGGGADEWRKVAAMWRTRGSRAAVPLAGGIDVEDRASRDDDSLLQPGFRRGMYDDPPGDSEIGRDTLSGLDL